MEDLKTKASVKPDSKTEELTYQQLNAFDRLLDYLQLNHGYYVKIERVVSGLRTATQANKGDADALLKAFAEKCYASDPDTNEAERFLNTLYGTVKDLYEKGPRAALRQNLAKQQLTPTGSSSSEGGSADEGTTGSRALRKGSVWKQRFGKYLVGSTLGKGGTSVVKLGKDIETEELVAVKILNPKGKTEMDHEVSILRTLDHPNILRVRDYFKKVKVDKRGTKTDVFVLDYAENGEVIDYLIYTKQFEEPLARWFFKDCVKAIEHNFQRGVMHRDIKHDNVLLAKHFQVKLADYGFAVQWKEGDKALKEALGTACYAAPELLKREGYGFSADIYSLGVMLFVALIGRQPFKMAAKQDKYYKHVIKKNWEKFWKSFPSSSTVSQDAKILIQGLLERNPKERLTLDEIKKSRWYNGECFNQEQACKALKRRKQRMDNEKRKKGLEVHGDAAKKVEHRGIGDAPTPIFHWSPTPEFAYGFYTETDAQDVMHQIRDTINEMKGRVEMPDYEEGAIDDSEVIDLTEAGRMKMVLEKGGVGLLDEPVQYLADGTPNPFKAEYELLASGSRVLGSWEIYTEQLNEEESREVADRINQTATLIKARDDYQAKVLAKMTEEADDNISLSELEAQAKKSAKEHLASLLGDSSENQWISKQFYTESDRRRLGKKNIVVFKLTSVEKPALDLAELAKGDLKGLPKWYSDKGLFAETLNQVMERNAGLIATFS